MNIKKDYIYNKIFYLVKHWCKYKWRIWVWKTSNHVREGRNETLIKYLVEELGVNEEDINKEIPGN